MYSPDAPKRWYRIAVCNPDGNVAYYTRDNYASLKEAREAAKEYARRERGLLKIEITTTRLVHV